MFLGTGHRVPEKVLTNADLERIVDTTDQWIVERTGIRERHIKEPHEKTSDFCFAAAEEALAESGLKPADLDLIIIGTVSGDMPTPSTAIFVQARLGAFNAAAFDVSAACSGFLYALNVADAMIAAGRARYALVIGAECLSIITDWQDRNTCVLFGDGAGAAVLGPSDGRRGVLSTYVGGDGRLAELLWCPAGGSLMPASHETVDKRLHSLKMAGREVFLHAVKAMGESSERALAAAGLKSSDIDLLIPHQANLRIIEALAKRLSLPLSRVYVNIDRYGNTSSASVPIALNEARRSGRLQAGMNCLMVVFGGGFTWGSAAVKF
ncbi:MAG: ketoacyl-ACP synthase III [Candidatus Zixiibacteriota bacterium]|nr:MAG: ketoacyl-ACP synthase III [candidate division Zixibacteria bacterium]